MYFSYSLKLIVNLDLQILFSLHPVSSSSLLVAICFGLLGRLYYPPTPPPFSPAVMILVFIVHVCTILNFTPLLWNGLIFLLLLFLGLLPT